MNLFNWALNFLKQFILNNPAMQQFAKGTELFLSYITKFWFYIFVVQVRRLIYLPFYFTAAGFICYIIPFIDLALVVNSIGTYDSMDNVFVFISENMPSQDVNVLPATADLLISRNINELENSSQITQQQAENVISSEGKDSCFVKGKKGVTTKRVPFVSEIDYMGVFAACVSTIAFVVLLILSGDDV